MFGSLDSRVHEGKKSFFNLAYLKKKWILRERVEACSLIQEFCKYCGESGAPFRIIRGDILRPSNHYAARFIREIPTGVSFVCIL
jgi:hypothetical protein